MPHIVRTASHNVSWKILKPLPEYHVALQEAILCLFWMRRAWRGIRVGRGAALASWSPSWWTTWSAARLQGRACG